MEKITRIIIRSKHNLVENFINSLLKTKTEIQWISLEIHPLDKYLTPLRNICWISINFQLD